MIKPSAEAQKKNLKIIKLSVDKYKGMVYNNTCKEQVNLLR